MIAHSLQNAGYTASLTPAITPVFLAPADGSWLYIDGYAAGSTGGAWSTDINAGAYPRDGKGTYTSDAKPPRLFTVQASQIHLDALSGYGCDGPLGLRITRLSTGAQVYYEAISQTGSNSGTGSNRDVTLPLDNYLVEISRIGGVVAFDGIGIRR